MIAILKGSDSTNGVAASISMPNELAKKVTIASEIAPRLVRLDELNFRAMNRPMSPELISRYGLVPKPKVAFNPKTMKVNITALNERLNNLGILLSLNIN